MAKASQKNRSVNLVISVVVALAALVYFSQRSTGSGTHQDAVRNPVPPTGTLNQPGKAPIGNDAQTLTPPRSATQTTAANTPNVNHPETMPAGIPADRVTVTEGAAPVTLPADLQAQLDSAHQELPEDLKKQLAAPPPELPADLKAQLNAPPAELPEDIKRALNTPPRIVSIDEVNNPGKAQTP